MMMTELQTLDYKVKSEFKASDFRLMMECFQSALVLQGRNVTSVWEESGLLVLRFASVIGIGTVLCDVADNSLTIVRHFEGCELDNVVFYSASSSVLVISEYLVTL